eukprot:684841-Pelagomonas_calceolata.AAC.2
MERTKRVTKAVNNSLQQSMVTLVNSSGGHTLNTSAGIWHAKLSTGIAQKEGGPLRATRHHHTSQTMSTVPRKRARTCGGVDVQEGCNVHVVGQRGTEAHHSDHVLTGLDLLPDKC